jgi:hypothetical protein
VNQWCFLVLASFCLVVSAAEPPTYDPNIILSDASSDNTISRQRTYADVAAHELAHQWFGDLVTASIASPSTSLKLYILDGRPFVSNVFLNGRGPYRFLLDTGAKSNQVDTTIARELGATATFRTDLFTPGGSIRVVGARLAEVTLGDAHAANQEFLFTNLDSIRALSKDVQGVLGQEFLSHFDYLLDLRSKTLTFGAAEPAGDRVATGLIDGLISVATSVGRLVLDSGTETLVLFHIPMGITDSTIRTAAGVTAVSSFASLSLQIAGRDYHPRQSAVISQPDLVEDGLLPLSLLKAVYISSSLGYIVVDPGPSKR